MKLSIEEYKWIIGNDDLFSYISTEETAKYYKLYKINRNKAIEYLDTLRNKYEEKYSYVEIISTDDIVEVDLEKSYIVYKAVIKLKDKYYSFEHYYSPYWNYEDQYDQTSDLIEVLPHQKTITEYY